MGRVERFEYIMDGAKSEKECRTNKELAEFHYFNANGVYAKKKELDNEISEMVKDGIVPSGWILAYGTLSDCAWVDSLIKYAMMKRPRKSRIQIVVNLLEEQNEKVEKQIKEAKEKFYN